MQCNPAKDLGMRDHARLDIASNSVGWLDCPSVRSGNWGEGTMVKISIFIFYRELPASTSGQLYQTPRKEYKQ